MHAWHPLLVHFPLTLLLAGVIVEAIAWWKRRTSLLSAGRMLLTCGVLLAVPTVATGLLAYGRVDHSDTAHSIMTLHRNLMLASVGLFAVAVIWRWRAGERVAAEPRSAALYAALLVAATAALVVGGDRGADLVFEEGLGIPSERMEAILSERYGDHHHASQPGPNGGVQDTLPPASGETRTGDGETSSPPPSQPTSGADHDDAGRPAHEH